MSPGTEFVRDFCAGIGPLQLGVVLVIYMHDSFVVDDILFQFSRSQVLPNELTVIFLVLLQVVYPEGVSDID